MTTQRAATVPGFLAGVRCFFAGSASSCARRGSWPLALVPAVAVVALGSFLGFLSIHFVPRLIAQFYAKHVGSAGTLDAFLSAGAQVVATVLAVLLSFFERSRSRSPSRARRSRAWCAASSLEVGIPPRAETSSDRHRPIAQVEPRGLAPRTPYSALLMVLNIVFPPRRW
ncbi:MAG: hypothetical protein U5J78_04680 [Parasphingorhabdus sp.]|nr:hypothetical protein [Parasphingorhabdus sp.]